MIVTIPNKVLITPAKTVNKIDKKVLQIVTQMKKDLLNKISPKGVGLAAPQVGIALRLFITRPTENSPIDVFINPVIVFQSVEIGEIERPAEKSSLRRDKPDSPAGRKLEGCLSIPNVWGYLKRPKKVRLKYMGLDGQIAEKEFSGFMATIVQHETDHVNGILFTQRVLEQKEKLYEIEEDSKGNEKLTEIKI